MTGLAASATLRRRYQRTRGEADGWKNAGGRGRLPLGKAVTQAWALWLAGLLALIGGLALLCNPGAGLRLVRWTLGLFLLGWGVMRLVHAFTGPRRDRTWLVLSGLCILGAGIVVLAWPGVTATSIGACDGSVFEPSSHGRT